MFTYPSTSYRLGEFLVTYPRHLFRDSPTWFCERRCLRVGADEGNIRPIVENLYSDSTIHRDPS